MNYEWYPGPKVSEALVGECSTLYSSHYGVWSGAAKAAGEPIRLSPDRLKDWLRSPDASIALARTELGQLVGYAIAIRTKVSTRGFVSWVTQLVVHEDFRRANVAKRLLFSIWGFSDHFAWGLVTANPYAVRALEKATRRRCIPDRIVPHHRGLKRVGVAQVPYIDESSELIVDARKSCVNTRFFLDHSRLPEMITRASAPDKRWLLGGLDEGWEWFAFTFREQDQMSLEKSEIDEMLQASDQVTMRAYSRMVLTEKQAWMRHTDAEADFVVEVCRLTRGNDVLDVGCGNGRHSISLATRGLHAVGVDYVRGRVEQAREAVPAGVPGSATFLEADSRRLRLKRQFDAVICLYDVVGSYADDTENARILATLAAHLRPGGYCLLSVMSLEATLARTKNLFSLAEHPDALLTLPASRTMESSGDVFDPELCLVDAAAGVVYRKEQFGLGRDLPEELIVRDRRFRKGEIQRMCEEVGLEVLWTRYVRAGAWNREASATSGKEILVLCRAFGRAS